MRVFFKIKGKSVAAERREGAVRDRVELMRRQRRRKVELEAAMDSYAAARIYIYVYASRIL